MADDDEILAPSVPSNPLAPWSGPWPPPEWGYGAPAPVDEAVPGIGIPAPFVDTAALAPDDIEMPVDYVGAPTVGFPRAPEAPPAIEAEPMFDLPPDDIDAEPLFSPEVDAVSNPGPIVPSYIEPSQRELASEQLRNPADPEEPVIPYGVELTDEQRARQFAAMSPEEQAKSEIAFVQRRQAEENRRRAEAALADEQRALENIGALRRSREEARIASAKLDEEAKQIAEVDEHKWMKDASVFQKAGAFVAAIVGGLVQSRQGGANQGLAFVERLFDKSVETQKANIASKRADLQRRGASIQQRLALDQEEYELNEKARLAMWTRLQNTIAADMQQYDPRGKNAIELGKVISAIASKRQQALIDFEDRNYKQRVDAYKADADLRKTNAEIAKMQAETKKLGGAAGGAGAGNAKRTPEYFAAQGLERPPVEMTDKEYKAWLGNKKGSQEIAKNSQELSANARAGLSKEQRELGIPGVTMADGSELIARGGTEEAKVLRKKVAATRTVVRILDEVDRIRTGWTSDIAQSPEWQQLKADWATAKGVAKDIFGLGALSGPDEVLIENALGAKDPTQVRDFSAALSKARANMINLTADELDGAGLDNRWNIPKPKLAKPAETATDTAQKRALSSKVNTLEALQEDLDTLPRDQRPAGSEDAFAYYSGNAIDPVKQKASDGWVPPGIRRHIDELASKARSGDEKAHAMLGELAQKGGSPGVRAAAQVALTSTGSPSDSVDLAGTRDVARDTVAEPPKGKK